MSQLYDDNEALVVETPALLADDDGFLELNPDAKDEQVIWLVKGEQVDHWKVPCSRDYTVREVRAYLKTHTKAL